MSERHQINRRVFIRDFGRGVLGITIGGSLLSACGDGTAVTTSTTTATSTTALATTTSSAATPASSQPTTTTIEPTTTTAATAPASTVVPTADLTVQPINLGIVFAYLLVRGTEVGIVDTGGGGRVGDIEQALSTVGLGWGSVGTVIITHKHGDHVGSLTAVLREVTGAIIGAGEADIAGIGGGSGLVSFADGETVFGSTVIATPGHTAGHISVWDEETRVLIAGDALNGGGSGVQNVDGVGGPNANFTPDMGNGYRISQETGRPPTRQHLLRPRNPKTR